MSTRKQRDARKERFWRCMIRQRQRSGLTARAFCQKYSLAYRAGPRLCSWLAMVPLDFTESTRNTDYWRCNAYFWGSMERPILLARRADRA